jgi:hypothetical protein
MFALFIVPLDLSFLFLHKNTIRFWLALLREKHLSRKMLLRSFHQSTKQVFPNYFVDTLSKIICLIDNSHGINKSKINWWIFFSTSFVSFSSIQRTFTCCSWWRSISLWYCWKTLFRFLCWHCHCWCWSLSSTIDWSSNKTNE